MTKDLSVRHNTLNLVVEKVGITFQHSSLSKDCLTLASQEVKPVTDKLDFMTIKKFYTAKET